MIYRGDDTGAFGNTLLTIILKNAEGLKFSKAVFRCEEITKEFENPTFPLKINFTSEETSKMYDINHCYLAVWDEKGRKQTCQGSLTLETLPKRI